MVSMILLLPGPVRILGHKVDLHIMVLGSLSAILGYQTILLGLYARIYAVTHNFLPQGTFLRRMFHIFNLERGLAVGAVILMIGLTLGILIFSRWVQSEYGPFDQVRLALFASTLIIIGSQTIFASFFLSMLGIERR
jgi:hypothetical protein